MNTAQLQTPLAAAAPADAVGIGHRFDTPDNLPGGAALVLACGNFLIPSAEAPARGAVDPYLVRDH